MKKVLSLIMILVSIAFGCTAFAQETVFYGTVEPTIYAETYLRPEIRFFSNEKTLEETLIEGWTNLSPEIQIGEFDISIADIGRVYRGIVAANPTFYYVSNGCLYSHSNGKVLSVAPEYTCTDMDAISETISAINEATEEILMCIDESMTDFEKIMTVHDYMVLHYEYDYTYSNYDITIMTTKTGVCMAYSYAFQHLMNELGIDCLYVTSESMVHGWNLVKVDGEWYHIDLTWDDPNVGFGMVTHTYALLSDYEIQNLETPHLYYDLNGLTANSDKYDKSIWRESWGAIVTINGTCYYVDGNNLVDQNGKIIYENLKSNRLWSIGDGYGIDGIFAGLSEHNGILYFNTDRSIFSYDPKTDIVSKVLEYDGICGLFIDKNTLLYSKFDTEYSTFAEAGKYSLGTIRFGGTLYSDGKIIKRIYTEDDAEDFCVLASCKDCVQIENVSEPGLSKISFDEKSGQTLFFWTDNLKPLKDKEVYNP